MPDNTGIDEQLLVNFKNLMQQWFPLTTTVNNKFTDVMDKSAVDYNIRSEDVLMLNHNTIGNLTTVTRDGWVYDAVESFLEAESSGSYGVIKYMNEFAPTVLFFRYDMVNETLDLLNNYHVNLESSNYNPNIDSNVTITATVTDEYGNPIQYFPVSIKKNGSSLSSGITNSNGQFSLTHQCTEWGLTTFSTNNGNIGLFVVNNYTKNEFRFTQKQSLQSGKILVFSNNILVHVVINGNFTNLTANGVTTLANTIINSAYRPSYNTATWGSGDGRFGAVSVQSSGEIKIVNNSSSTNLNIRTTVTYPLQSQML